MKANEAPEKIYVHKSQYWGLMANNENITKNGIEYTRTDAFIEKAVKWIEEINNHHHIIRYSDCCESPLIELTEWFKNYMKRE